MSEVFVKESMTLHLPTVLRATLSGEQAVENFRSANQGDRNRFIPLAEVNLGFVIT